MKKLIATALFLTFAMVSYGQVLDLPSSHSADVSSLDPVSVEAGLLIGDVDSIAGRVVGKTSDNLAIIGDLTLVDNDELAVGVGALVGIDVGLPFDTAVKAGFNTLLDSDADLFDISGEAVFGSPISSVDGLAWYGNLGLHYVDFDIDDDLAPALGGGVTYRMNEAVGFFGGIEALLGDFIYDDTVISAGVKYTF